jgi:hypothetical protein
VARNNYGFEKRQRELNKEKKKEEKRQRKLERKVDEQGSDAEPQAPDENTLAEPNG